MSDLACVGIDQSYKRTGISVSIDGKLLSVNSYDLHSMTKHQARMLVSDKASKAVAMCLLKANHVVVILERIRLFSQQFISMPYIMSMGEMNGAVFDRLATAYSNYIESGKLEVMTVETRAWKRAVVGTTKGAPNAFGVPESKWPSVELIASTYPEFEDKIMHPSKSKRQTKSNFQVDGALFEYDDDAVDSACISLFPFSCQDWMSRLESME